MLPSLPQSPPGPSLLASPPPPPPDTKTTSQQSPASGSRSCSQFLQLERGDLDSIRRRRRRRPSADERNAHHSSCHTIPHPSWLLFFSFFLLFACTVASSFACELDCLYSHSAFFQYCYCYWYPCCYPCCCCCYDDVDDEMGRRKG